MEAPTTTAADRLSREALARGFAGLPLWSGPMDVRLGHLGTLAGSALLYTGGFALAFSRLGDPASATVRRGRIDLLPTRLRCASST